MMSKVSSYLLGVVSPVLKLLNILALGLPSSAESDRHQFAWVAVSFTTELTSIVGLMTISPEGGP